ncbi:hypothetical protein Taro_056117, partial [Colocasia esculenta]|nr:hypothetical protein [Colocasia esculenta]
VKYRSGSTKPTVKLKTPKLVRWIPPSYGYCLNVDGACKGNLDPCGGGGCLRDSNGDVHLSFAYFYGQGNNVIAEVRALCDGLRLAEHRGLSISDGYAPLIQSDELAFHTSGRVLRFWLVRACLDWPKALSRVCACLLLAGLVVSYKPVVRRGSCCACPACSPGAWYLRACPVQRLSPFPGTPILGILLREFSGLRVCSSWQPSWRTLERRGKRGLDSGAESFVELSCLGRDAEIVEVFSSRRGPDSPLSHYLSLRWFRSHTVVLGVGPQLGQAAVLRAFVCFCGGSASLFRGGEAGARLASRGRGRHVPLLDASSGGWVSVVVMKFPHDASKYDSLP